MRKYALCATILSLALFASPCEPLSARAWQTGRLVTVEISGQNSVSKSGRSHRDIWWTYTLRLKDRIYSAVSRESPTRIGVAVDDQVKFSVESNRIYLVDSRGKEHVLRVLRISD